MPITDLFAVPPAELVKVRKLSHAAVQWPSRAARANLEARLDDSHSNLGWRADGNTLVSHMLDQGDGYELGFCFSSGELVWIADGVVERSLALRDIDEAAIGAWCDERLSAAGLEIASPVQMPYELESIDYQELAGVRASAELAALGAWYARAQLVLEYLMDRFRAVATSAADVRCWPHHYDLGMLLTLDEGDPEIARSIGVGFSPGDDSFPEPYFYCTPWPTPDLLPVPPPSLHWHTEGFTSLVCPASRIEPTTDLNQVLSAAVSLALSSLQPASGGDR